MMLERRTFLKRAGLGILSLGIGQTALSLGGNNQQAEPSWLSLYARTLAATTPRKLALLVGVDDYLDEEGIKGSVTDVELQQDLLIYRFGFQSSDVLKLTGEKATRAAVETAFVEHLMKQAKSGDVVVFHFSGYGRQLSFPANSQTLNTLVVYDSTTTDTKNSTGLNSNELLENTILLLAKSLSTEKITLVFDTSYAYGQPPMMGNWRVRSLPPRVGKIEITEVNKQWELKPQQSPLILSACRQDEMAREILGREWNAGLFTYNLSQYLWQVTPASKLIVALSQSR